MNRQRYAFLYGFCLRLIMLYFVAVSLAWSYVEIPELSRRITDLTGTLTVSQIQTLENKLAAFEAEKGSQIALLMVGTTQPSDIAEFGIEVFDYWQLGRKGSDDGLLLIVAKDDRKVRLEVGRGLEGVIPDAVAKRIGSDTMVPFFKNNDYYGGINAGLDQIIQLAGTESLPPPRPQSFRQQGEGGYLLILFGGLFAGSFLLPVFGRIMGGLLAGIGSGVIASLLMGFGIGAILVGVIVFFLTSSRFSGGGGGWSNGGGHYGGGGYYGGGSWGGGSSGGTWSGGGGSAAGGGATSSW